MRTSRLEGFSDGVIAIAITLLVLDVRVPEDGHGSAVHQVLAAWPAYVAYALSFFIIGLLWVAHHQVFAAVERADSTLLHLNLALLGGIAFLPFPTQLLARSFDDEEFARVGPAAYSLTMVLVSTMFAVILMRLAHRPGQLTGGPEVESAVRSRARQSVFAPLAYLAAAPLAWVSPWLSMAVTAVTGLTYATRRRRR